MKKIIDRVSSLKGYVSVGNQRSAKVLTHFEAPIVGNDGLSDVWNDSDDVRSHCKSVWDDEEDEREEMMSMSSFLVFRPLPHFRFFAAVGAIISIAAQALVHCEGIHFNYFEGRAGIGLLWWARIKANYELSIKYHKKDETSTDLLVTYSRILLGFFIRLTPCVHWDIWRVLFVFDAFVIQAGTITTLSWFVNTGEFSSMGVG